MKDDLASADALSVPKKWKQNPVFDLEFALNMNFESFSLKTRNQKH